MGSPDNPLAKKRVKSKISISTSRQPRKLKFGLPAYINPTRKNMNKKNWGHQTTPPTPRKKIGLSLKLAALCNLGSIQLSFSQAKAKAFQICDYTNLIKILPEFSEKLNVQ